MNANTHTRPTRAGRGLLTAAALGLAATTSMAQADVKVVAVVRVSGLPAPPPNQPPDVPKPPHFPQTVTTYYKGSRARVEVTGGSTTIYDADAGKAYRLDPSHKTYFALSLAEMQERGGRTPGPPPGQGFGDGLGGGPPPLMAGNVTIKAAGKAKKVAGQAAHQYAVSGTFQPGRGGGFFALPPDDGSGDRFRGRRGFFGPPPPGPPPGPPPDGRQFKSSISGTLWLSDTVLLPGNGKTLAMMTAREIAFGGGPAQKFLADALAEQKRLPLAGVIVTLRPPPPPRPWEDQEPAPPEPQKIVTTMTVTAISQAALSDALFEPPSGYTQVAPPRRRLMGPPPDGGGRFDGPPTGGDWGRPLGPPPPGDRF